MTTMLISHCISRLNTKSRFSAGEFATTSAPLVANGLESTTEDEIDTAGADISMGSSCYSASLTICTG